MVDQDQPNVGDGSGLIVYPGESVGQTFVAHHGGLSGVDVWMSSTTGGNGKVVFHLREDPDEVDDLRTATIDLSNVREDGFHRVDFAPIPNSHGKYFYGFWDLEADDATVEVSVVPGDTYLNGALYKQHRPQDAQLVFNLVYTPAYVVWDLIRAGAQWAFWLLLTLLAFILPGLVLLRWLYKGDSLPLGTTLGLGAGISLALYPLLMLWTDWAGFHLGALYAWLPVALSIVGFVVVYRPWRRLHLRRSLKGWATSQTVLPDLALLALVGLVFAVRFIVIRTLDGPMWGDSQQHATIVQLMLDNGGLFRSWEPYAPFETFTVHFGFHSITVVFAWLTGMGAVQATLVVGQIVNGLAILTLYPLAERLWGGNRWAGVGAVLVGGLLSPMPAYYVNWGRYPQLAGQAILPVALWLVLELIERRDRVWPLAALAGFVTAGMALAYYRMPFYFATFLGAWLIYRTLSARHDRISWQRLAVYGVGAGGIASILLSKWALRILSGSQLTAKVEAGVTTTFSVASVLQDYQVWRDIKIFVPVALLAILPVAVVVDLIRRRWVSALLLGWIAILTALVAGRLVNLPGSNMLQNFAIMIALYIPVSLLIGGAIVGSVQLARPRSQPIVRGLATLGLLGLGLYGARFQTATLDTSHLMVTRPDTLAMDWIAHHTQPDAVFLVEGFTIYNGGSAVGADAGWWIPVLGRRQNTMPPQYALLNEYASVSGYPGRVVDLVSTLQTESVDSPQSLQLLCDMSVTHVYLGQRQGLVGSGVRQLYSPETLSQVSALRLVHEQDRARIYAFDTAVCVR